MLTIWGRRNSSNVQVVMWLVGELGLAYRRHDVGHRHGGNDTTEFLAMNPNGLVPVVRDGEGEPLFESSAILRYLAARYGGEPLWPKDPEAQARVDVWAEWAKTSIVAGFTHPIFWRVVRTAPADRDETAIKKAVAALDAKLDIAETQLSKAAHLAGEDFTLADIQFGHLLYRYFEIEIPRPRRRALASYYDRLRKRPAFREHVMVPFDDLRVT